MLSPVQTVTIAQALASDASGLVVVDSGADIANVLPDTALTGRVAAFTLSGSAVLTAAQTLQLALLGNKFHLNGYGINLSDTLANIDAPANAAAVALARVHQASDYAYHLLSASRAQLALVTSVQMIGATTVSVAQLTQLKALPGFHLAQGAQLTLADTATHIAALLVAHPGWFALATAMAVRLDGSVMASAQAAQLSNLAMQGHALSFVASGANTKLLISGALSDLTSEAAALNRLDTLVTPQISLSSQGGTVSMAQAQTLEGLNGFSFAGGGVTLADTGSAITQHIAAVFGQGFAHIAVTGGLLAANAVQLLNPVLQFQGSATALLSTNAIVSASQAATLAALPGFALGGGVSLIVAGLPATLVATPAAWQQVATGVQVTGDATLQAAGATALAALATQFGGQFSLGGHNITVADTLAGILGLQNPAIALLSAVSLAANATATVAQFNSFKGLPGASLGGFSLTVADAASALLSLSGNLSLATATELSAGSIVSAAQFLTLSALPAFSDNGFSLTIQDNAANLLALAAGNLSQATVIALSSDAVLSVSQAQTLTGEPNFSQNGFHLTISDTAANLVTLPHALQVAATAITLDQSGSVSAAQLNVLAGFGVKFFDNSYVLTVADNAANLAALGPAALALTSAEVLNASATVNAARAALLAALPALSCADGVTLTVQDSVANLLALGAGAPGCVTSELLLPGRVTVSAAQAAGLASLPHFSATGATITVADSVANLTAQPYAAWTTVASGTDVVDTAANLAANAASALLQNAGAVTLFANGIVSAAQAAALATIPHYSAGNAVLEVADGAVAIAGNAAPILQVAQVVVVSDSGPVTAAQAETLVGLANAGVLSFQSGVHLTVQDSYAHLADPANLGGVELAARIIIVDTAANLVTASLHDWGGISPSYQLDQAGTITAAQAQSLGGLGAHYGNNGYTLSVADGAVAVAGAAGAIVSLGVVASVADTAGAIDGVVSQLAALGARLAAVAVTDPQGLTAASAAGLAPVSAKLTTATLGVSDTAVHVVAMRSGLMTLGARIQLAVTDSAAGVAANATSLASLAPSLGALAIALTDTAPVLAGTAAGLAPVVAYLAADTLVAVSDSGASVVANATGLQALLNHLGTITLANTTLDAATAAGLVPLDSHFGQGVTLAVTGTGASIAANLAALQQLAADMRLGSVTDSADSVAVATANAVSLNAVSASVSVTDTAAHVNAGLAALASLSGLTSITLSDGSTPRLSMTLATMQGQAATLQKITSAYSIGIADTAAHIQADLVLGAGSLIAGNPHVGSVTVNDGQTVSLTQAALLASAIGAGIGFSGALAVSGVDMPDLSQVIARGASSLAVTDTAAALASGLAALSAHHALLSSVTLTQGGTLTAAQLSGLAALPGFSEAVYAIAVDDTAPAIAGLNPALLPLIASLTLTDSAAAVAANELALATLHGNFARSFTINLTDSAPILVATAAGISPLAALLANGTSLAVSDTASAVAGGLAALQALGSALGSITITSPTVSAAVATQLVPLASHLAAGLAVADSVDDVVANKSFLLMLQTLGKLASVSIAGASVANVAANVQALNQLPTHLTISDSAASVQGAIATLALVSGLTAITLADVSVPTLTLGVSVLENNSGLLAKIGSAYFIAATGSAVAIQADLLLGAGSALAHNVHLASITVTGGGTVTLSQSLLLGTQIGAQISFSGSLAITGVDLADLAAVIARGPASMAISDSTQAIATDLQSGAGLLASAAGSGKISGITATGGSIDLTVAQIETAGVDDSAHAVVPLLNNGGIVVTNAGLGDLAGLAALRQAPTIDIQASAADVFGALTTNSTLYAAASHIGSIALTGTLILTDAQAQAMLGDMALDHLVTVIASSNAVQVTGVPVADLASLAASGWTNVALSLVDTAAAIEGQAIQALEIAQSITVRDSAANIGLHPLTLAGVFTLFGETGGTAHIELTGSTQISAALAAALLPLAGYLGSGTAFTISDTAQNVAANATALSGFGTLLGGITLTNTTVTAAQAAAIAPLDGHLGNGVTLAVQDNAAAVATNAAALLQLQVDGHLGSVLDAADSVGNIVAGTTVSLLNTLGASVSVLDSAADVQGGLDQLAGLTNLTGITLTDGSTPAITVSLARLIADRAVLSVIGSGFTLAVSGTASAIEADLAQGAGSVLAAFGTHIASLSASDANPVVLTLQQFQTVGIDDGPHAALAHFSGALAVTGVTAGQVAAVFAATTAPSSITVSDSAAALQANLGLQGASSIVVNDSAISAIAVNDGGILHLTATAALTDQVVLAQITGSGGFVVSGATLSQFPGLLGMAVQASQIGVSDTAANLSGDLALGVGHSLLLATANRLSTVVVSDGGTIILTESQARAAGIDDSAQAVLARLSGAAGFLVTGVAAGDIGTVLALHLAPTAITVSDTAATLVADLATLTANTPVISHFSASDGLTLALSADQALGNGVAALLAKFQGSYAISGATVAQLPGLAGLPNEGSMGANIIVTDNAAHIVADILLGGAAQLLAAQNAGRLGQINVGDGNVNDANILSLTDAQAVEIVTNDMATLTSVEGAFNSLTSILVTGVTLADASTVLGLYAAPFASIKLAIVDTLAHITTDLDGADRLAAIQSNGQIASVSLTTSGTVNATELTQLSALTGFSSGGHVLAVSDTAAAVAALSGVALGIAGSVTVQDSAAAIGAEASALLTTLADTAHVTLSLTDATPVAASVAAALSTLSAYGFGGNALDVTDLTASVAADAAQLAQIGGALGIITLTDANIVTVDAQTAAALAPLTAYLAGGTLLSVSDTAGAIGTYASQLTILYTAGNAAVSVSGAHVQDIVTNHAALNAVDATVTVSDLAANVQGGLDSLQGLTALSSITLTDQGATPIIDVSVATLAADHVTLGKIISPVQIDVRDSAANIRADLLSGAQSALAAQVSLEHAVDVTDAQPVVLTQAEVLGGGAIGSAIAAVLVSGFFNGAAEITGVQLANVAAVQAQVTSQIVWAISDTAADIEADLANLGHGAVLEALLTNGGTIDTIAVTGGPIVLDVATAEATMVDDGASSFIAKVTGATLSVTGAAISDLAALDQLFVLPSAIALSDTAGNIATDLALGAAHSALLANRTAIASLVDSDSGTIGLTASQALAGGVDDGTGSIFARLTGGFVFDVTGASVSQMSGLLALDTQPDSITVVDTATHIAGDVTGAGLIAGAGGQILSVTLDGGGTVSVAALTGMSALPGFSVNGQTLVLQDNAAALAAVTGPVRDLAASIDVQDTGSAIGQNIDGLQSAFSGYAGSVTIEATGTVPVTTTQYTNDLATLHDITGSGVITVTGTAAQLAAAAATLNADAKVFGGALSASASGVSAAVLTTLAGLAHFSVAGFTLGVSDSATNVLAASSAIDLYASSLTVNGNGAAIGQAIDALQTDFAGFAGTLQIVVSGGTVGVSASQFTTDRTLLDKITMAGAVTVTGSAAALNTIATALDVDPVVGAARLSASASVAGAILASLAGLPGFSTNGFALTLADTAAGVVALSPTALGFATDVHVTDTSLGVTANLAALSALSGFAGTLGITLNDATPAISVTAVQFSADQVAIAAITNAGAVTVAGSASQLAAIAGSLASTASVGNVTTSDSAANVAANLPGLQTLANAAKLHVTITDGSIPANLVTPLLALAGALTNGATVSDTPSAIATLAESAAAAITYLNLYGATLNTSGSLGVSDAAALESLTNFRLNGFTLSVWDTASHLVAANAAVFTNPLIGAVYLKTTGGAVTVTAATAAALLAIPHFSSGNPPGTGGSNSLSISDTAAHLEAVHTTLAAHLAQFTGGIQVSASATVTDAVLSDLQALQATAAGGVTLAVRDTAANIAATAAAQAASPYITPVSWSLSGNATVSEAQAATLGGLTGFSAGLYKLTLNLAGNTAISIADANNLGNIAASLLLGSNALTVAGTVSQLATLTNNAQNLVTPLLSDAFGNILAVNNALLLKGSVTVTDSESITAGQATSFLGLLTTQGGAIHPTSLLFANGAVEAVTSTVASLQTLQASAAWTNNSSVHAGFSFTAKDSVANLIAGGNTSFLASVSASTLSGNQSTDAASAETLALLESSIHFNAGSAVLTVQDTAANLIAPTYVDGLALAGNVELSGAAIVAAAGAETLFGLAHFTLNQSLTIADNSANLLDGVLSSDINGFGAYVRVELAASETLDAQTAETLVGLTGFTDPNGNLNIADSSSYLLASANLTSEQLASSVTLVGDETVSANTILRLSELPHFTPGSSHLLLATNDFADAATLQAIGNLGANFDANGHSITATAETLDLAAGAFTALQSDNLVQNGHVVAAISDASNMLTVSGLGATGDTIKIYDDSGSVLTSTGIGSGAFTVTAADAGMTHNFAVSDVAGGVESAPVVVLDAAGLVSAVSGAGASFATYGDIQIGGGQFLNIYQSTATLPAAPALVYNATTHVISLDIPNQAPVALVTLGGSTLPSSLTAAEIFIKHHS